MHYPLYEQLLEKVNKRKEKNIDIKCICITINNISNNLSNSEAIEHYQEIAALILHHDLISNNGIMLSSVPYEGKTMIGGKGLLYVITNFPPQLQQIIAQYVEEYSK